MFTLFIPAAIIGGWKLTLWQLIVQMFGLLPNLNWFAWYVFFYIFCMLVMPILCEYNVFRFKPWINLCIMIVVPYILEVILHSIPNYENNTFLHDLFSCFLYFPCFLIGYWMAENRIIDKVRRSKFLCNSIICIIGILSIFAFRIIVKTIAGFLLDVFYAPILICLLAILFEKKDYMIISPILNTLGKYSTGIWFFHAVFFSGYVCEWFKPVLMIFSWPPLMFLWLVLLSLLGAYCYQKILDTLCYIFRRIRGS